MTEGINPQKEFYGFERLASIYQKVGKEHTSNIMESIFADQTRFRSGMSLKDDTTIVAIEIQNTSNIINNTGFIVKNEDDIDEFSYIILKKAEHLGYSDVKIKQIRYAYSNFSGMQLSMEISFKKKERYCFL